MVLLPPYLPRFSRYTNLFDFWYAEHWQDFEKCGPTPTCPHCTYTPASDSRIVTPLPFFQNGAKHRDSRCVFYPSTLSCWVKNTSQIQIEAVKPRFIYDWGFQACSRFRNGTRNPEVKPDPGGLLTDVDAMVALTKPEYSGSGPLLRWTRRMQPVCARKSAYGERKGFPFQSTLAVHVAVSLQCGVLTHGWGLQARVVGGRGHAAPV